MAAESLFLFFLATSGLSLSLFFSVVLFRLKGTRQFANRILGLLLFCLSLRITKSVFYNFIELPLVVKNLGLAANLAIGPLLYLYGKSLFQGLLKSPKWAALHFLPTLSYVLFSPVLPNGTGDDLWRISYSLVLGQSFIYVALSLGLWWQQMPRSNAESRWYLSLSLGLGGMWTIYALVFFAYIPVYLAGAISFSFLIIAWIFLAIKEQEVFLRLLPSKYPSSHLSDVDRMAIMQRVEQLLVKEKHFLDPSLSLAQLAKRAAVHPKTLSQVINESTGKNFTHLINSHRVKHAQKLFSQAEMKEEKVIAIALDSGFRSLSTFNVVFKQYTKMTPSAFRSHTQKIIDKSFPDS